MYGRAQTTPGDTLKLVLVGLTHGYIRNTNDTGTGPCVCIIKRIECHHPTLARCPGCRLFAGICRVVQCPRSARSPPCFKYLIILQLFVTVFPYTRREPSPPTPCGCPCRNGAVVDTQLIINTYIPYCPTLAVRVYILNTFIVCMHRLCPLLVAER